MRGRGEGSFKNYLGDKKKCLEMASWTEHAKKKGEGDSVKTRTTRLERNKSR